MDPQALIDQYGPLATAATFRILGALAIILIGYWVAKLVTNLLKRTLNGRGFDPTLSNFICKLVFCLFLAVAIVPALAQMGVQTASVIAALGAAGLAVGLALQGSLSNFAAGVLIIAFRPCRVGDWIEAGGCSGTVESISLFSTTLLTGDYKRIMIPNSQVMSGPVVNYSVMPRRRIDLVVSIAYSADMDKARDILQKLVDADERILKDPAPVIKVNEMAASSIDLICRPWVATADFWPTRWQLVEDIKKHFDAEGIEIPFPQMDVHFHKTSDAA